MAIDAAKVDSDRLDLILNELQRMAQDFTLRVKKAEPGSLILSLEGSEEGFERLSSLFESGHLSTLLGIRVITLVSDEAEAEAASQATRSEVPQQSAERSALTEIPDHRILEVRRKTRDLRIESIRPLISPAILLEELPLPDASSIVVSQTRDQLVRILDGEDDRLIVVVGPCSIHDPEAGLEYGRRLKQLADELEEDLCVVMRVYFEKPRTTVGWKGFINDPHLDGSCRTNEGLRLGRKLLLDLLDIGVPAGCEFLDPISPQFISDLMVWGAIGARTTESQVHRQLASGLSVPVGFKNGTDGRVQAALDAIRAAAHPHSFIGVTEQGLAAIVTTRGNEDTHAILRGGDRGTNYDHASVQEALTALERARLPRRIMIDTSHGNSGKDHARQPIVAHDIVKQVANGERGIIGIMLESFLVDGRQDLMDRDNLVYGQSITDACMGWEMTVPVLHELAAAVRTRRNALAAVLW